MAQRFKIFLILIFILLMLPLAQAELQEIGTFENCTGYTFFVGINGLGPIYEEGYTLLGCEFLSKNDLGVHTWVCSCEDNLNLTIETLSLLDTTFSVSVLRVAQELDYNFIQTYTDKNISVKLMLIEPLEINKKTNLITGNATFLTTGSWSILSLIFILLLAGLILFNHLGGLPWTQKQERALKLHKQGQHAFESSKLKKAKRYYRRASKLRK